MLPDFGTSFAVYPSLRGRAILVTGGGSGIGASLVEHFCAQGARVAFVDINAEAALALVDRLRGEPLFEHCDLRDIAALRAAIGRIAARIGAIRVLVNNAANDDRHAVGDVGPEYWRDRMAVNLDHQFFAAQAVFPGMREAGGGSIINMSSIAWQLKMENLIAYQTAKAGVIGLTRALAREYGPANVRVNSVLPGWIMTERQIALWLDDDGERATLEAQCLKEMLYPPDVARLVMFLAADDSRMCTAQGFAIDGGHT